MKESIESLLSSIKTINNEDVKVVEEKAVIDIDSIIKSIPVAINEREELRLKLECSFEKMKELFCAYMRSYICDFRYIADYDNFVNYMIDNKGRGLIICGQYGLGKSIFLNKVYPQFIHDFFGKSIKTRIYSAYNMNKNISEILQGKFAIIDDIGAEGKYMFYGNEVEGFSMLIDNSEKNNTLLFASSNLSIEELKKRYGDRTFDRLKKVCSYITMNNKYSLRNGKID